MTKMSEAGRCSSAGCRWDESAEVETQEHLPRHYVLLDRYYIGRVLGQGGFGVTYIAHDLKLDRTVAIKEFLPKDQCSRRTDRVTVHSFSQEKGEQFRFGLDRFLSEAQNIAKLGGHPNIVSITDYSEANGTAYMVMEFIPGVTLKQYLADQGGRIPYATAKEILLHVMAGLSKSHEHGLIHRDVSPDNIMLSTLGPVKLIDFGAARQAVGEKSQNLTMVLKPGYAPEEQYRSRGVQGPWTDVYATAATLYRCVTGQVPPAAPDRMAEDELIPPARLCKDVSSGAEAAILRGLTIRASARPQTIKEFRQLLIGQTSPPPPSPPAPVVETARIPVADKPVLSYAARQEGIKLYTPRAVWLAAFFGTAFAGCIVLAINYKRLNKSAASVNSVIAGFIITAVFAIAAALTPQGGGWSLLFVCLQIGISFGLGNLAEHFQGDAVKENQALGAPRGSYWAAFGIGLATLLLPIAIDLPIIIFQQLAQTHVQNSVPPNGAEATNSSAQTPQVIPTTTLASTVPNNSGSTSDARQELLIDNGILDYQAPITQQQARAVSEVLSDYFADSGSHVELSRSDQGGLFVMTIADTSDAQEVATGQEDVSMQWLGRALAIKTGGFPAELRLVNVKGETLRNLSVEQFVGLFGVVEDPTGAVISLARVTVTNSNGVDHNTTTGDTGIYQFPNLAPGSYFIDVQANGFSRFQGSAEVPAGGTGQLNVNLKIGTSQ